MYGHSPWFSVVNAEVDSMGGVVDGGVSVDNKASPRRAAIEKAQEELRQEYYVREERKRELEFLEKGGNPLDFKFGTTTSVSVQSTSLTDQLLDYDAKGSSVLATSPHGDSVDSSGRPGGTVGREQNTADNILLIDGQNSNHDGTRNAMHSGKRKLMSSSEHSSKQDGSNLKESDESGVFRLKSQAYARRNRSRPTRDSAHVGSAHLAPSAHGNNSSAFPSSCFNSRDKNGPLLVTQVEDHALSSISNSKPASPCSNNISRALDTGDQVEMDLDAVEVQEASGLMLKVDVGESETEVTTSSHLQQNDCNDQAAIGTYQQCPNGTISLLSEFTRKEMISVGAAAETLETEENTGNATKAGPLFLCTENVADLQNESQINIKLDGLMVGEVLASSKLEAEPSNVNAGADSHITKELKSESDSMLRKDTLREKSESGTVNVHPVGDNETRTVDHELLNPFVQVKNEDLCGDKTDLQSEERHGLPVKEEGNCENMSCDTSNFNTNRPPNGFSVSVCEPSNLTLSDRSSSALPEVQIIPGKNLKLSKKTHEDAILKEAWIIEARLKRINELSLCSYPSEKRRKSHWDYVIEEMAWLANDFTQERLWKISAASQISRLIASSSRSRFEEKNLCHEKRKAAHSLAKVVMSFWHLAEVLQIGGKSVADMGKECNLLLSVSLKSKGQDAAKKQDGENLAEESSSQAAQIPILCYAVRFLKHNRSFDRPVLAEAPATPERICDAGVWGMTLEDQFSEESLFYLVPAGAMHHYRESVESNWLQHEKTSNTMHREDYEASTCDSLAEYGSRENVFEEDEAETDIHYLPGVFEVNKSKFSHKKRKTLQEKSYGARSYEVRSDLSYGPYLESKLANQPSLLTGKRPPTFNVCSIPTKKMRTASRQRVASPFSAGNVGGMQITSKTDVSSGDTSSFQDDQSSLQCGSQARKNAEIESTADFEKKMLFVGTDMSKRSKKKKPKHMGYKNMNSSDGLMVSKVSSYEHRWLVDPMAQQDQKDYLKNRLENRHFDPNGSPGLLGQHSSKKLKLLKKLPEASPESITPITGSISSPAASQMSSMSNPSKLIKMITSRDRGRKNKPLKIAAGQLGSGGSWSQFEDQALVVLVHDMGPNWELVSDAINSTLQFKCIFRKPNECKDRHRVLMERSAGDGADSAEDSGSSQSYPSTLPGIPKGSARQLFQRLQGPMEEDTLKAHFEKIILIGRQLHFHRNQSESKEMKQIAPVHNSHLQACLNNLTGSPMTPLDLCKIPPSPEALGLEYQGSHSNALPTHPGALGPVMPGGANSLLQVSPSLGMNNGLSSPSAPPIAHTRDSPRYGVPRATFPVDEQQRMQQQYSQMLSNRNVQQQSVPGALPMGPDRNVRMLSGGNSMGMMCGINSGMPMARPGFQGIGSPSVLNVATSGSMLPTGGVGMSNPVNLHSNTVPGQGNSLWRPRDHLQMQRPPQNPEDHKQMMMQELQLPVTQGNCQSVASGNGVSAPFSSQGAPPSPIQTFSAQQHQQPHQMSQQPHLFGNPHHSQIQGTNHMSSQQQAYAMRLAKERQQLQQRLLHQQQHFSGSNAVPPSQNSSQVQQQSQSSSVTSIPSSQVQHKQQNIPRNPLPSGGVSNQMLHQRQRQQLQQQQPRHQQQRQQTQQQVNLSKGLGGGNMLMHQNVPVDASHVNAPSTVTGNQVNDRQLLQQGQGFFSGGSGSGSALPQSSSQQKIYSRPPPRSSKTVPPMSSHSDTCNQSMVQVPPSHPLMTSHQSSLPSLPLASQQQQRQPNHSPQVLQRMKIQPNHQMNSDGQIQSVDQVQVNQMIVSTPASQCTDPGNAISVATSAPLLSASHWKPEPSFETAIPAPSVQLPTSPQQNLVGTETPTVPSCQGLVKRPFSGSLPMHVHGIGGQWQQSKPPHQQLPQDHHQQHQPPQHQQQHQSSQLQQQQQHQLPQHQPQHRHSGQSALYVTPSNSGPG